MRIDVYLLNISIFIIYLLRPIGLSLFLSFCLLTETTSPILYHSPWGVTHAKQLNLPLRGPPINLSNLKLGPG